VTGEEPKAKKKKKKPRNTQKWRNSYWCFNVTAATVPGLLVCFILLKGSLKLVIVHWIAYVLVISYIVEKPDSPALTHHEFKVFFHSCENSEFWGLSAMLHLGVPCFVI
jgi:hypothetical protein